MKTITVTRRSRNIGWAWTCYTREQPEGPSKPEFTGTIRQVFEHIDNDRDYQSMKSGGTFTSSRFFVDGLPVADAYGFSYDIERLTNPYYNVHKISVVVLEEADCEPPF